MKKREIDNKKITALRRSYWSMSCQDSGIVYKHISEKLTEGEKKIFDSLIQSAGAIVSDYLSSTVEKLKTTLLDTEIAVKDKSDVLRADEILGRIGISIFSSEEKKNKFIKNGDDVKDNFLIQGEDGWRIQSHFLGFGVTTDELEEKINRVLKQK